MSGNCARRQAGFPAHSPGPGAPGVRCHHPPPAVGARARSTATTCRSDVNRERSASRDNGAQERRVGVGPARAAGGHHAQGAADRRASASMASSSAARCTTPASIAAQSAASMISGSSSSDQGRCAAPCVAEDVVGDAVVPDLPRHLGDAPVHLVGHALAGAPAAAASARNRATSRAAARRHGASRRTAPAPARGCGAAVPTAPSAPGRADPRLQTAAAIGTGSAARWAAVSAGAGRG